MPAWVRSRSSTRSAWPPRELALPAFLKPQCLAIACKYWNKSNYSYNWGKEGPCCFPKSRQNNPLQQRKRNTFAIPIPYGVCAESLSPSCGLLPAPHLCSEMLVQGSRKPENQTRGVSKAKCFLPQSWFLYLTCPSLGLGPLPLARRDTVRRAQHVPKEAHPWPRGPPASLLGQMRSAKAIYFFLFSLLNGFYSLISSTEHSCPQGAPHRSWAGPWVRAGTKESQSLKCALHQDQEAEGDSLSSQQGCAPAVKLSQEATDVKHPR